MDRIGKTAVVAGRSMAGLGAAAALSKSFENVLIVDRDEVSDGLDARPGIGQGHHVHNLLKGGELAIEHLLPGATQDLLGAGAVTFNQSVDTRFFDHGERVPNHDIGFVNVSATRWLMEKVVRERLMREPGVSVLGGRTFQDFATDADGRVTGLVASTAEGTRATISADLVVDCTGRGSRTRSLLSGRGYDETPEFKINIGVSYTSALVDAPADALAPHRLLVVLPNPPLKRGVFISPVEGGRWLVSLHTRFEKDLPKTYEEMLAFAAGVEVPDVHAFLKTATLAGPIRSYQKPEATWRRFDKVSRFPEGLLVLGDAITSFNPVYGQGMSVALLQARALDDLLRARASGGRGLEGIAQEFFKAAVPISREAWNASTLVDAAYEEVTGDTQPGAAAAIPIMRGIRALLADDPALHRDYLGVSQMVNPSAVLLTPERIGRAMEAAAKL
jgi:2-polyprenyl-6-methoxyphenol hydroxylase-like FAD-dependent oxidoreductase